MNYFIYNPKAGNFSNKKRIELLHRIKSNPNNIILETEKIDDEFILTQKAINEGAKTIIAIGGDGTFNKVASRLVHKEINMGLVPIGSGNGIARHLGISMNPLIALDQAINGKKIKIDVCSVLDKMFFCTAGIGFDAEVAKLFNISKKRGLINYIKSFFAALINFTPITIQIENGKIENVFLLTIANANQYGNNAFISPNSNIQDGIFEVIKIKKSSLVYLIPILFKLFLNNLDKSKYVEIVSSSSLNIKYQSKKPIHIDGESFETHSELLEFRIIENALIISI